MSKIMLGSVNHQLDEKSRMRIPAKFRDGIGVNPYVLLGKFECLYVFPSDTAADLLTSVLPSDPYALDEKQSEVSTLIAANSTELTEDPQGRAVLPKNLKDYAHIKKDIVVVGKGKYLEIWAAEIFNERFSVLDPTKIKNMLSALTKRSV